jgi:hypothetical protein
VVIQDDPENGLTVSEGVIRIFRCAIGENHRPNLECREVEYFQNEFAVEPEAEVARRPLHHGLRNPSAGEFLAQDADGVDRRRQAKSLAMVKMLTSGPPSFVSRQNWVLSFVPSVNWIDVPTA